MVARATSRWSFDECQQLAALHGNILTSRILVLLLLDYMRSIKNADWEELADDKPTRNNSMLVDGNKAHQKLTANDIANLKASDASGRSVIDALTEHSATFATKTEFAQQKYKKKKAKKHVQIGCARRPSGAALCAAYYARNPARCGYLRPDTLSILLHAANVGAGSRALVLETCGGIVTGAVAERQGGYGEVCSGYLGSKPSSFDILKNFNFPKAILGKIRILPLSRIITDTKSEVASCQSRPGEQQDECHIGKRDILSNEHDQERWKDSNMSEGSQHMNHSINQNNDPHATLGVNKVENRDLQDGRFTSCIITIASVSPLDILQTVMPLLAPSSSFAIAYPSVQPLAELLETLRTNGLAVNMSLYDAWMRDYQVLPKRTRPMMSMDHGGGYLLSGTVTLAGSQLPTIT